MSKKSLLHKSLFLLPAAMIFSGVTYIFSVHANSIIPYQPIAVQSDAGIPPITIPHEITKLSLPSLGVAIAVKEGEYNTRTSTWLLDDIHAFYVHESATPLLYGHAISSVFGPLNKIKDRDELLIESPNSTFTFTYIGEEHVAPQDVSVLNRYIPNTLLLMTCHGINSEERRILYFAYKDHS